VFFSPKLFRVHLLSQLLRFAQRPTSRLLAGLGFLLSSALLTPAAAQTLVGEWELRQVTFMARQPLPDSLQAVLIDDSAAFTTNEQLQRHQLTVRLTLRADSTYRLHTSRPGQPATTETGTYSLRHQQLRARTTTGEPALFDGQLLTRLTKRALVWEHPIWGDGYQVYRQLNYVRLN